MFILASENFSSNILSGKLISPINAGSLAFLGLALDPNSESFIGYTVGSPNSFSSDGEAPLESGSWSATGT
jgi:hypothetical protein